MHIPCNLRLTVCLARCGLQDYGGGLRTLSLCPPTPNCISTAEEANDPQHYVPQW